MMFKFRQERQTSVSNNSRIEYYVKFNLNVKEEDSILRCRHQSGCTRLCCTKLCCKFKQAVIYGLHTLQVETCLQITLIIYHVWQTIFIHFSKCNSRINVCFESKKVYCNLIRTAVRRLLHKTT